ncbi:hypothetical protein ACLX1H_006926 [Fusarium chlamydosporum]
MPRCMSSANHMKRTGVSDLHLMLQGPDTLALRAGPLADSGVCASSQSLGYDPYNLGDNVSIDLLIHVLINEVKILCCTPVTSAQIVNHSGMKADFIALDEASRMTETMSVIPMSKCPEASFLLVGDVRQFGPVVTTVDREDWPSFFGPQRATSLFKGTENSGAILYRLKSNYRARGHAADFVREKFYEGQMTIVNKNKTPATAALTEFIGAVTKSHYPSILVDVPEADEVKVGTGYTNPATARLALSMAIQIYRESKLMNAKDVEALQRGENIKVRRGTILIVTLYLTQNNEISFLLFQATVAELPPGFVEVRTADSSLPHSAFEPSPTQDRAIRGVIMNHQ